MSIYETQPISRCLEGNAYPGRGIIIGKTADGRRAAAAYFIMGRSANSRNRVFTEADGVLYTAPYDDSAVEDPSLIIYAAIREFENHLIITNGDHTNTVYEGLKNGISFHDALATREFEPDGPNWTPRISGMLTFGEGDFTYQMSILKSGDPAGTCCCRVGFNYVPQAGLGHFLHTYACDGDPLPPFWGEPERVAIPDDIDAFTKQIWSALDPDNKISLYVRYTDLATGETVRRLVNKNQ